MLSFGLMPTITVPTRIKECSATLLDNIFINCSQEDYLTRAIYDDISDHLPILINISSNDIKSRAVIDSQPNRYIMSEKNFCKFQTIIRSENWSILENENINLLSPHESYNIFIKKFKESFDRSF